MIVRLFLCAYQNKKAQQIESPSSKWLHTLYIGGIAAFILLEFIVYVVLNNDQKDNIIDTISFGSTLSSLILSVVAIIFTIVHGRNGESQLGKITQATSDLTTSAKSLEKFKDIADDINSHVDIFQKDIDNKIAQLTSLVNTRIDQVTDIVNDVRKKTQEVREHQLNQAITQEGKSEVQQQSEISVQRFIEIGSYLGAEILLSCCLSKQAATNLDFTKLGDLFEGISIDYGFGYMVASCASGIITVEGNFPNVKVIGVANELENMCIDKIKKFIIAQEKVNRKNLLDKLNIIMTQFGRDPFTEETISK